MARFNLDLEGSFLTVIEADTIDDAVQQMRDTVELVLTPEGDPNRRAVHPIDGRRLEIYPAPDPEPAPAPDPAPDGA